MPPFRSPGSVLDDIRREVDRSLLRGRNGIRHVTGTGRARVGQTPKETVWRRDKVELWRYTRSTVSEASPVVLVMSVVTRSYIFDLLPGESIVERLLDAGYDVFLVDWGIPDAADSDNTLETYVLGYLPEALIEVRRHSGHDAVSIVGYCLGGLLSLLCLAADTDLPVRNLVLMATPVDFDAMGLPVTLIREGRLEPDMLLDADGNVPPDVLLNSFRLRNPTGELVQYVNLLERLWNDEYVRGYQAMNQWIHDHIPFPGALARQLVDELVRHNRLMSGGIMLGGRPVRLGAVTCPLLNVMAENDDVVPVAAAEPAGRLVGSADVDEVRVPAGHVALVTGRLGRSVTIPGIIDWLGSHQPAGVDK
jgi:poly[(R)-3-hydroxyalkanoate] polymerase subunit PhaC